jgi:glycosyltransferase involved in cell wall biosynthesis
MVPTRQNDPQRPIRLAIDASNIRAGGGVTHLIEILKEADPPSHGFDKVMVWARAKTLARIEDRPWLEKRTDPALEAHLFKRLIWQRRALPRQIRDAGADLLLAPGGSIVAMVRPVVTMSRNMLPFEWRELKRFGYSLTTLKLALLRRNQGQSFRRADGTIFLTRYAYDEVTKVTGPLKGKTTIIPHGVDARFRMAPRRQRAAGEVSAQDPLRVVYVSIVDEYKHQWQVVEAVGQLHRQGIPIRLDLYGAAKPTPLRRLTEAMQRVDSEGRFIRYRGAVDYQEVHTCYASADICVFASSCENMPNILIESMAAGLPIACSDRGPMPEVLGDAGVYFDPENPLSIAEAVRTLTAAAPLRAEKAAAAFAAAAKFSWSRCARETFDFLAAVARDYRESLAK